MAIIQRPGKVDDDALAATLLERDPPSVHTDARGRHSPRPVEGATAVMVADDCRMSRMVMRELLRDSPCHLDFAENGLEALERVRQKPYGVVFMDLRMPVMDGFEAVRQIRRWEAELGRSPLPIIALSAGVQESDRRRAVAAGCTEFVAKPVGKAQLWSLLSRHLAVAAVPA